MPSIRNANKQRVQLEPIDYVADAAIYYRRIRHLKHPIWLDSCAGALNAGEMDLLSAAPESYLSLGDGAGEISRLVTLQSRLSAVPPIPESPFVGGCMGYLGYEANHARYGLAPPVSPLAPLGGVGLYTWALVQNHREQKAWLVFHPQCDPLLRDRVRACIRGPDSRPGAIRLSSSFRASITRDNFIEHLSAIQDYIRAGDCYQVNYAQHFVATCQGDPLVAYEALREISPTPLAALLEYDWGAVLSLSPERFLQVRDREVSSFPIKGTAARGTNPDQDEHKRRELLSSLKDRAENLMIVDLMRNDLSQVCEPGSVKVPRLFELQSFPAVHHLVSEVRGRLAREQDIPDLLQHCLPGGSITGAPKRRAMEIIAELEPVERSIYCGSIFYWSSCGSLDSNIAIRTLLAAGGVLHCWGGGGITADSDPRQEYQETLDKVRPLMDQLERRFLSPEL